MTNEHGTECWSMSSEQYCKAVIQNVEEKLARKGRRLPTKDGAPLKSSYKPEIDITAKLKAEGIQYYQELIGALIWAIELGRAGILLEVSLMLSYSACPRIGLLE